MCIRDSPNGTGKTKKVLVIAKGAFAEEAASAGADFVGDKDMICLLYTSRCV